MLLKEVFFLILGQAENIAVAAILTGIYWVGHPFRIMRYVVFILFTFLMLFLISDQIFYSNFFDHIQFGYTQGEANLSLLFDSFLSQLNTLSISNLVVGIISCVILGKNILPEQSKSEIPIWFQKLGKKKLVTHIGFWTYMVMSVIVITKYNHDNLLNHPLFSLINSYWNPPQIDIENLTSEYEPLEYKLQYDQSEYEENLDILNYAGTEFDKKPNVIFIILESIGAYNIFSSTDHDQLNQDLTPNLFKWKDNMVIYPRIYNIFPGTTRSHITIGTGGHSTSWGSPSELLDYNFTGATYVNSFKEEGYHTALFSSLILLNTDKFYNQLTFDHRFIPSLINPETARKQSLNSWGLKEDFVVSNCIDWIKKQKKEKPYFLQILTSCTHHPYSTPDGYKGPFKEDSNLSKYKNAIHYTDSVLGELIDFLQNSGELDNTIIAITGDHGQAFGDIHKTNKLHRSNIYEENIRNFLMILDARNINKALKSNRIGGSGDIMPTVLSRLKVEKNVPGQSLLSETYQPRIQYQHNFVNPYKWGLVDGKWKFISQINDPSSAELYNLEVDNLEQNNVADDYPDRIQRYQKLCGSWYYHANQRFVSLLEGFGTQDIDVIDLTTPGPKILKFGTKFPNQPFTELEEIHPQESLFAYTSGIAFPENVRCDYEWINPQGKSIVGEIDYDSEWSHVWVMFPGLRPIEQGRWTLKISESESGKELISDSFVVSDKAKLVKPFTPPPFTNLSLGLIEANAPVKKQVFNPNDKIVGILEGPIANKNIDLLLEWSEPDAQKENNVGVHYAIFKYQKGWGYGWFYSPSIQPMKEGRWRLTVYDNDSKELLLTQWFNVFADHYPG